MSTEETNPTSESQPQPTAPTTPQTAGQRLAAQKAAKAARKAAKRGNDAEQIEEKALAQARLATVWYHDHQKAILAGLAAVVVLSAIIVGIQKQRTDALREGGKGVWEAVETATATIRPEGESTADAEGLSFASPEARAKRATEQFRAALGNVKSTEAKAVSELGIASGLLDAGDWAGARGAFEKARAAAGDNGALKVRAIEGIAFAHEAEKAWDKADALYNELRTVDFPRADQLADYHHARILLAKGETDQAKTTLKKLIDSFSAEQNEPADGRAPQAAFLKAQAEARLAELDPSAVKRGGNFFGGGGISQEELQRLLEQMQAQQGRQGE